MSVWVQVEFEPQELDRIRSRARQANQAVSEWIHDVAVRNAPEEASERFETVEELQEFFDACDARQGAGREPDWDEQKEMISDSILSGLPTDV